MTPADLTAIERRIRNLTLPAAEQLRLLDEIRRLTEQLERETARRERAERRLREVEV